MTDQQSQQRINEAADQFTDALVQSYKVVAERGASAQEQGAQVTEVFFNQAINNLHAQAEENRQASDQWMPTCTSWTRCSPGGRGVYRQPSVVPGKPRRPLRVRRAKAKRGVVPKG